MSAHTHSHVAGARMPRSLHMAVGFILVAAALDSLLGFIDTMRIYGVNSFQFSEMLIDFGGGFVRRGLLGDVIHRLCTATGTDVRTVVYVLCIGAYAFVTAFFAIRFRRHGLCWWLLASIFMCGQMQNLVRKDYLLFALLIAIFVLLSAPRPSVWRTAGALALAVAGMFLHEAFIFWGLPVAVLTLLADARTRSAGIAGAILLSATFALLSAFKGSEPVAMAIVDGWKDVNGTSGLIYQYNDSIGALAWDAATTFRSHFTANFHSHALGWAGLIIRPLYAIVIYYFLSNFLFIMAGNDNDDGAGSRKTLFSALLLLSFICLLPMYTVLSCDFERLAQYIVVTSTGAMLILPEQRLRAIFAPRVLAAVSAVNCRMARAVRPTPVLLTVMLLLTGIAQTHFDIAASFAQSPVGACINLIQRMLS